MRTLIQVAHAPPCPCARPIGQPRSLPRLFSPGGNHTSYRPPFQNVATARPSLAQEPPSSLPRFTASTPPVHISECGGDGCLPLPLSTSLFQIPALLINREFCRVGLLQVQRKGRERDPGAQEDLSTRSQPPPRLILGSVLRACCPLPSLSRIATNGRSGPQVGKLRQINVQRLNKPGSSMGLSGGKSGCPLALCPPNPRWTPCRRGDLDLPKLIFPRFPVQARMDSGSQTLTLGQRLGGGSGAPCGGPTIGPRGRGLP